MKTIPVTLRHICLEIANLDRSMKFYGPLFAATGFTKIMGDKEYAGFSNGAIEWFLCKSRPRRVSRKPPTGQEFVVSEHLAFLLESPKDVDRIAAHMKKAGIEPLFPPEEHPIFSPGFYAASFCDPDQVVIEFYYRPPAKKAAGKKVPRSGS